MQQNASFCVLLKNNFLGGGGGGGGSWQTLDPLPLLISRSLEGWHVCHSMLKLRIHFRLILIVYTKCINSSPYTHVAV